VDAGPIIKKGTSSTYQLSAVRFKRQSLFPEHGAMEHSLSAVEWTAAGPGLPPRTGLPDNKELVPIIK
jgi:hypothetical protein